MSKQSSYQKLKDKNLELRKRIIQLESDIYIIIEHPNSERAIVIRTISLFKHVSENMLLFGNLPRLEENKTSSGFLDMISQNKFVNKPNFINFALAHKESIWDNIKKIIKWKTR
jgi:hypothetical protein